MKAVSLPATMMKAQTRCGGLAIAQRLAVMPMAEAPVTPTLPLHQSCSAIHSTVS